MTSDTQPSASDRVRAAAIATSRYGARNDYEETSELIDEIATALAAARREGAEKEREIRWLNSHDFLEREGIKSEIRRVAYREGAERSAQICDAWTDPTDRTGIAKRLALEIRKHALPLPEQNTESSTRKDG